MFKIMLVSLKIELCMFCVFGDQQSMSICTCKLLCHVLYEVNENEPRNVQYALHDLTKKFSQVTRSLFVHY